MVNESLACCLKSSPFFPDFDHSFLITLFCCVAAKITVNCKFFLVHFLCWCLWFVRLLRSSFVYLNKEQAWFAGWRTNPTVWLSREHLPIMAPRSVDWVPHWVTFRFDIFIMGSIQWLCQTQGLFKIGTPVTNEAIYILGENLVRLTIDPTLDSSALFHIQHAVSHGF